MFASNNTARRTRAALPAALAFILAAPAVAQQGVLEEIIVTAQKRLQSLQDVPISVSVITGKKLAEVGLNSVDDLDAYVPNLSMSETGISNNVYIRGIGSGINPGFEQSTAMFVDGVHYGRGQLYRAPIFDMERIEVLRGPQSMLFGKNAIAGAISLATARPTDEFEGSVGILYEPDHDEQQLDLVLSGPISDNAQARLSVRKRDMGGYIENIFLGTDETDRDELTARLQLSWQPTNALDINLKYERNEFDVTGRQVEIVGDEYGFPFPIPTNPVALPYSQLLVALFGQDPSVAEVAQDYRRSSNGDFSNNESDNFTLTLNYDWDDITVTSVTSVLQYEFTERCDCDFGSAIVIDAPLSEDYDQISQEIRFTSPGGQSFDWFAGLFFQTNEQSSPDTTGVPAASILGPVVDLLAGPGLGALFVDTGAGRTFAQDTDSWHLFGQGTWTFADDWRLTAGLRYTDEEKTGRRTIDLIEFSSKQAITPLTNATRWGVATLLYANLFGIQVAGHDLVASRSDSSLDYVVSLQWDMNEDVMWYGSIASGFKSGGFDARSNATPTASQFFVPGLIAPGTIPDGSFEFEDERALSFEIGTKLQLAGGRADLNIAAFFTNFDDLQISIFDGVLGFNVGNAAEADIMGLEIDGRWQATANLGLFASVAFTDFEFKSFQNGQCFFGEPDPEGDRLCDRTGETNQYVADYSGVIGAEYIVPIGDALEFRSVLDLTFTDDYITAQNNDPRSVQDGYTKVNLRVGVGDQEGRWEVALLGRNLTDEDVVSYSNPVPLSGTFGSISSYQFIERPRSIAIQGSLNF